MFSYDNRFLELSSTQRDNWRALVSRYLGDHCAGRRRPLENSESPVFGSGRDRSVPGTAAEQRVSERQPKMESSCIRTVSIRALS
jgi:hypothetical protein